MNSSDTVKYFENLLGGSTEVLLQIGAKYDSYKARAKRTKIDFTLSFRRFDDIVKKPCHYCKVKVSNKPMGIDRVDNSKGYVFNNCVPSCWTCNRAKSDMSYVDFTEYLSRFK
jgi:hypothetical protein